MLLLKIYFKIASFFKKVSLKILFGKRIAFKKLLIRRNFKVLIENGTLKIGKSCFFNNDCSLNCLSSITIGDNCIFGEKVCVYDHNHIFNKKKNIMDQGFFTKPVVIGNNCWLGTGVIILAGTTIGDNVVVGAGITLSGNVPSNSVVKRNSNSFSIEPINFRE